MWHRLNREDFAKSNLLLDNRELRRPLRWRVYEDYEILPSTEAVDSPYVQAAPQKRCQEPKTIEVYEPLTDTPYLFLEFARISENSDPNSALDTFFRRYGLLGLTPRNVQYSKPLSPEYELISRIAPDRYHDDRGGHGDYLDLIWALVFEANESLNCYEAALSRDEEKLEHALFPDDDPTYVQERRQTLRRARSAGRGWIDLLVDRALGQTMEYVMGNVYAFAYPDITYPQHQLVWDMDNMPPLTVDHLTRSWGARNLIGAMSLQFYWLITSASGLSNCKHCGRIISYSSPFPDSTKRKPRKDKEFCNSRCRQNYHYHNRTKAKRQGNQS